MFDPSKVEREFLVEGHEWIRAADFDACAAALAEAREDLNVRLGVIAEQESLLVFLKRQTEALAEQRDAAVRVVREYRSGHCIRTGGTPHVEEMAREWRCPTCVAADEVLGGKQ